jgi:hypothetical protein
MRTMYADTLPLPQLAGGPNKGIGDKLDGHDADPSFETHKVDLTVPEGYVSRLEAWRRLAHNKFVRLAAAMALVGPVAACADGEPQRPPAATAEAASGQAGAGAETAEPGCYTAFHELSPAEQQECRTLIARMEPGDISKLSDLDEARWANYYRHVALGEKGVLHNIVRSAVIDTPNGAESAATSFLVGYQANVYRLAWLMQNDQALAQDPRTVRALLGNDRTDSEGYKAAVYLAANAPSAGQNADTYVKTTDKTAPLFTSFFAQNVTVAKEGEGRILRFTAEARTTAGPVGQTFTYHLYPYMEAHRGTDGQPHEKPDDPNEPGAEIFAKLGTPLLAGPAEISGTPA